MRPPGYEPGELPTAPLRDVIKCIEKHIPSNACAKVLLFSVKCKLFTNYFYRCLHFYRKKKSFAGLQSINYQKKADS